MVSEVPECEREEEADRREPARAPQAQRPAGPEFPRSSPVSRRDALLFPPMFGRESPAGGYLPAFRTGKTVPAPAVSAALPIGKSYHAAAAAVWLETGPQR